MDTTKTLMARIAEDDVQAEVSPGNRDGHPTTDLPMNPWTVVLGLEQRRLPISWWTGLGLTATPTARDVLERLLADAADVDGSPDFAGWCVQHGFDTGDRQKEQSYRAAVRQTEKLRLFLGEKYEAYLRGAHPAARLLESAS